MDVKNVKEATGSWRRIRDYNFYAVEDLPDYQPITITIGAIKEVEGLKAAGKVIDRAYLLYAKESIMDKPLILKGAENLTRLSKIAGTSSVEKWVGLRIILQPEEWSAFGKKDIGIRVAKMTTVPDGETGKVVLSVSSPSFTSIKEWLKSGKGTMESVTKKYYVVPGALVELKRVVSNGK